MVEAIPVIGGWSEPAGGAPRGSLVLVPGRGEHPGLYARFGRRISEAGYRVHAVPDPAVDETRAHRRIRALLDDAPSPVVLAGSDGGALFAAALVSAAAPPGPGFAGLVLAGLPIAAADRTAADSLPAPAWAAEVLARTACPTHQRLLRRDPAVRPGELTRPLPVRWFDAARPEAIGVPVLGLHGAADEISPLARVRPWYARLVRSRLVVAPAGRHDALNDRSHGEVAAEVVRFLEQIRSGAVPPGTSEPDGTGAAASRLGAQVR